MGLQPIDQDCADGLGLIGDGGLLPSPRIYRREHLIIEADEFLVWEGWRAPHDGPFAYIAYALLTQGMYRIYEIYGPGKS